MKLLGLKGFRSALMTVFCILPLSASAISVTSSFGGAPYSQDVCASQSQDRREERRVSCENFNTGFIKIHQELLIASLVSPIATVSSKTYRAIEDAAKSLRDMICEMEIERVESSSLTTEQIGERIAALKGKSCMASPNLLEECMSRIIEIYIENSKQGIIEKITKQLEELSAHCICVEIQL